MLNSSTGNGGLLSASGTTSVASDDLIITVTDVPQNRFGVLYMGPGQACDQLGDGLRGVMPGFPQPASSGFFRFPIQHSGAGASYQFGPIVSDSQALPPAGVIMAGSTWNMQCMYRDKFGPCGTGFNFSNAASVQFLP